GDCEDVCGFESIHMDKYGLPVVDEDKCTACNDCVEVCPKDLFSLQPISHKLWVACKSLNTGGETDADCEVVCTACGRCAADAPEGLITIKDNLATIDYTKNDLASKVPIERCPTGAIVWLDKKKTVKGVDAKKVIRMEPLPRG
ncbi:MAG: Fe-S cluster protein, partial [Gammaproteobacteria bacterium]|nr:Fe-S cluster protein [Gammaproteobacteria bacterium]